MGFFNGVKRVIKPLVDVPRWMQTKSIAKYSKTIKELAVELFVTKEATVKETFEQAQKRLNIDDIGLQERIAGIKRLVIFYLLLSLLALAYTVYLFSETHVRAGFVSFAVTFFVGAQFFRQHFWLMQLKYRKLGLDAKSWFNLLISGKIL